MRVRLLVVIGALALVVAGVAAALAVGANRNAPGTGSEWRPVLVGVCAAAAQAGEGDLPGARSSFQDVHEPLHRLADAAGGEAGGPLLRDKFRVEAALGRGAEEETTGPELAGLLRSLADEIGRAGAAAGDDPGSCP